jgi:hypothetical protein
MALSLRRTTGFVNKWIQGANWYSRRAAPQPGFKASTLDFI